MLFKDDINKIPMDRRALRNFGLLMALVLLLAGCVLLDRVTAG